MTLEEINKKAKEAFPYGIDETRDTDMLQCGYEKALEEISALPTIKGWVARDKNGTLTLFRECDKPFRIMGRWRVNNLDWLILEDNGQFSDLTWEDEPIEVELPIITKKEK